MNQLKRLAFRTDGQDLIEYALLASIISVSVVLVLGSIGTTITTSYGEIGTALSAPAAPPTGGGPGNGNGNGNGSHSVVVSKTAPAFFICASARSDPSRVTGIVASAMTMVSKPSRLASSTVAHTQTSWASPPTQSR